MAKQYGYMKNGTFHPAEAPAKQGGCGGHILTAGLLFFILLISLAILAQAGPTMIDAGRTIIGLPPLAQATAVPTVKPTAYALPTPTAYTFAGPGRSEPPGPPAAQREDIVIPPAQPLVAPTARVVEEGDGEHGALDKRTVPRAPAVVSEPMSAPDGEHGGKKKK